jgi:hypothetical protein
MFSAIWQVISSQAEKKQIQRDVRREMDAKGRSQQSDLPTRLSTKFAFCPKHQSRHGGGRTAEPFLATLICRECIPSSAATAPLRLDGKDESLRNEEDRYIISLYRIMRQVVPTASAY